MAALYTINRLLTGFGEDEFITRLLRRYAIYVCARVDPDGAAMSFENPPRD